MNLSEAIIKCSETRQSWISGSGASAAKINANHALRILGDINVYDIKTHHFKQINDTLLSDGYAPSTINQVTSALRTVLLELQECGDESIVIPSFKRLKVTNARPDFYSEDEIQKLLDASAKLDDHYLLHDSIHFAYLTGCRQHEMLVLTDAGIDWEMKTITFFKTKNGTDHTISLTDKLSDLIRRRFHYRIDHRLFPWDGAKDGADALRAEFIKVRDKLNIPDKKLWHTIRHTTGTHLVSKGVQIRVIMDVLNHTNVNTTLRYAKAADKAKEEAMNLL